VRISFSDLASASHRSFLGIPELNQGGRARPCSPQLRRLVLYPIRVSDAAECDGSAPSFRLCFTASAKKKPRAMRMGGAQVTDGLTDQRLPIGLCSLSQAPSGSIETLPQMRAIRRAAEEPRPFQAGSLREYSCTCSRTPQTVFALGSTWAALEAALSTSRTLQIRFHNSDLCARR